MVWSLWFDRCIGVKLVVWNQIDKFPSPLGARGLTKTTPLSHNSFGIWEKHELHELKRTTRIL